MDSRNPLPAAPLSINHVPTLLSAPSILLSPLGPTCTTARTPLNFVRLRNLRHFSSACVNFAYHNTTAPCLYVHRKLVSRSINHSLHHERHSLLFHKFWRKKKKKTGDSLTFGSPTKSTWNVRIASGRHGRLQLSIEEDRMSLYADPISLSSVRWPPPRSPNYETLHAYAPRASFLQFSPAATRPARASRFRSSASPERTSHAAGGLDGLRGLRPRPRKSCNDACILRPCVLVMNRLGPREVPARGGRLRPRPPLAWALYATDLVSFLPPELILLSNSVFG